MAIRDFCRRCCASRRMFAISACAVGGLLIAIGFAAIVPSGSWASAARPDQINDTNLPIALDFGVVRPSTVHVRDVQIENCTAGEWNVNGVFTSCGCTVADVKPSQIKPGGSALVSVAYTAPREYANDRRQIYIDFGGAEPACIALQAQVRPKLVVFPERLRVAEGAIRTVRVLSFDDSDWDDLGVESKGAFRVLDCAPISADKLDGASQGWEVRLQAIEIAGRATTRFDQLAIKPVDKPEIAPFVMHAEVIPKASVTVSPAMFALDFPAKSAICRKSFVVRAPEDISTDRCRFVANGDADITRVDWCRVGGQIWSVAVDFERKPSVAHASASSAVSLSLCVDGSVVAQVDGILASGQIGGGGQ